MDTAIRHQYRPQRMNPSFSSSLLDEIYRSIDDQRDHQETTVYRETSRQKQSKSFQSDRYVHEELCENVVVRRRSAMDYKRTYERDAVCFNSSSSSSDSSCGGGFSSSETESVYGGVSSRPKPIRTVTQFEDSQSKPKHEGKFVKTKSRALKIYGDLKKVKQPISPGGRLATFLNSLFTTNNAKNTKRSSSSNTGGYSYAYDDSGESKSANASTCSSASSYSRSCLSKTPSSRGKLSSNMKRSVRFYPVSVIVDEDCQPCGHKSVYGEESQSKSKSKSNLETLKFVRNLNTEEYRANSSEKTRRIEEAARNLLRNYQKKVECELDLIKNDVRSHDQIDMSYEDDEDDDAVSHTSSDLFELENFSAIGMGKYGDELPVYETTHLDTNLAIGNGFLM